MEHAYRKALYCSFFVICLLHCLAWQAVAQSCDPSTPSFTFDLTGHPDSLWTSPNVSRAGLCCGLDPRARPPIRCIEFYFTLDPGAIGIEFDIASGAVPSGSLGYQINCGSYNKIGDVICLDGPGPHRLTFCEPGNNPNRYTIRSVAAPKVSDPVYVSDGCTGTLTTTGYDPSTIRWTSLPFNATYNGYLNCTAGCPSVIVTAKAGYPPYVDYQVSGKPLGGCAGEVKRIVRAYFISDKKATILPKDPVICFGGTAATVTAYGSGGAPPYTYRWSTGATTQSIDVGIGTYWVEIADATSCPTAFDTVVVTDQPSPIRADAGPDLTSCANKSSITLQGSVQVATGGIWSGGSGTFSPNNTTLNAVYTPSAAEITAGTVTLTLTTSGNGICPAVQDQTVLKIMPSPLVNAGADKIVCANNATVTLVGSVSNATGGTWSGGTGSFTNVNTLTTSYQPSAAEITAGTVTLTMTTTGNGTCLPVSDAVKITITPAPTVNAGVDQTVCANNDAVTLAGLVTVATGGSWTGGTGTFSPNRNTLNASYTPSATEVTAGTVTLTLTTTGNGLCSAISDNVTLTITPAPTVNAGPDRTVCADSPALTLAGLVTVATGGSWTGGTGTFSPNRNTLNATYTPSAAEITARTVTLTLTSTGNGTCLPVSDAVKITITPAPTVNAGLDQTVCANNDAVTLAGLVTVATGGSWTGGTGTFSPNRNTLNASYTPSATEVTAGTVTLTLTTTGNGLCSAISDNVTLTITPAPTVNAGPDRTVCADSPALTLAGAATGATSTGWSGGGGSFSPNANTLNAVYIPSAAEITAGTVTLTLTANRNTCNPVTDGIVIIIKPKPVVNAGPDQTVCGNNNLVSLSGSVSNATGGSWTGGAGTFSPSRNTLNATYTPSTAEITAGTVTLTLTSTGNGTCLPVSDAVKITITPAPTVNAGVDQTVCANNDAVTLAGLVTVAMGGSWTGGTGTFSPNRNTLNASYTPSATEVTAGTVTLTLTSTGNGTCLPVSDAVKITITPAPTVNAGVDQTVCANNDGVTLAGLVTVATGGSWTGGTGTFSPNRNTLNATYTPSATEVTAGTVTLTLTSTGNGTCLPVSDAVKITITPAPTVNAGPDKAICTDNLVVSLAGAVTVATGGSWTGGTGTFSPNRNTLNATYTPSATEVTAGTVTLTLTSTGNGTCLPVSDAVKIIITPAPTVNAGVDQIVCAESPAVTLSGMATGAASTIWTGGNGSFSPTAGTLNAVYTPTAAEISAGTVTLTLTVNRPTCNPVTDQMTITIKPTPVVNAGPDQTVCANNNLVSLSGTATNATGGSWMGGTGIFSPDRNTLNATYTPSAAEIAAKTVTLTLTSVGTCIPVSDDIKIVITPAPTVNAGPDQTVCANNDVVNLAGSVTVATGGTWTGGTGTFSPNRNTLNAAYTPSAAEITSGTVTLTLTTTGIGTCLPLSDDMKITITPAPTANAGVDQTVCGNNSVVALAGSVTIATGGTWTGGTGTFSPNRNALSASYTPSAAEITTGIVTLTLTTTGNGTCIPVSDDIRIVMTPSPTANAGIDQVVCANNALINVTGSVTVATGGTWTSSGSGVFANPNALVTTYTPSAADTTAGTVTLTLTTVGNGTCLPVQDAVIVTIQPAPVVNAGLDRVVCADNTVVTLAGIVANATGGVWTGGAGAFAPDRNNLHATYTPSAGEVAAGTVTLTLTATRATCNPVTDQVTILITTPPTINAGPDQTVCANNATLNLNGSVTTATGGIWTGGTGTFSPNRNTLNATYTPSAAELLAGTVTLTLTSTGNGGCIAVWDNIIITITPAPTVNAGSAQTVCANNPVVNLAGTVTVATGGAWLGGTGIFSPDRFNLNAAYTPSASEIAAGTVTLTLSSTGNSTCLVVTNNVTITITPAPTIGAGPDQTVCADNATVSLTGTVTVASGGMWSGGAGLFSNANSLTPTYTPTATEIAAGSLTLTLTSSGNGTCVPVTDQVKLVFTPVPTANAGPDLLVCGVAGTAQLSGSITTASGGVWSGGAGTFSPNATTLNATYTPTAAEITAGSVTLTLTTTGNSGCTPHLDQTIVSFTSGPSIDAGPDQVIICTSDLPLQLQGTGSPAMWSGGAGVFTPDANAMNAKYMPTTAEILAGTFKLFLITTDNGACPPVKDSIKVTILPGPVISTTGSTQTVCADVSKVSLVGAVTVAGGGTWTTLWTTSGTGNFLDATDPNTTYAPSLADKQAGSVTLTLTSTNNGTCQAVSDKAILTITPAPVAKAGAAQTVCANRPEVTLNGNVTMGNLSKPGEWLGGTGTFTPDRTTLNAVYTPSASEITAGSVMLTLKSADNGTCTPVTNDLLITITPAPVVSAGTNLLVCANAVSVALNGAVSISGITKAGIWTTSGTGSFADQRSLNTTYYISAADTTAGGITLTLTSDDNGSCIAVTSSIQLQFIHAPLANAGADQSVCVDATSVSLTGKVTNATGGSWSGPAGIVGFSDGNALNTVYTPSIADRAAGFVSLTLTTSGQDAGCSPTTDQVVVFLTPGPTVDAGVDATVCYADNFLALNGSRTNATLSQWTTTGSGTIANPADLNTSYQLSAADKLAGSVKFTLTASLAGCNDVQEEVLYTISPEIKANAGSAQVVCADVAVIQLGGSVATATGGEWTSSGSGTFSSSTDLQATYSLSAADKANGTVTFTLTTTGNGTGCSAVSSQTTLTITPAPTVLAGQDQTVCANRAAVALSGQSTVATAWKWTTSGTGSFADDTALNTTYIPSAADTANKTVVLTLATTASGTCNPITDQLTLTITPAPLVMAGAYQTVCADVTSIVLNGVVVHDAGGIWSSSGSGTFFPDATTLNASYFPSAADRMGPAVTLTLTSNGNGNCNLVSNNLQINFTPAPTANAGADQWVCADASSVSLAGKVTNATAGSWSGPAGIIGFSDANSLAPTYTFSAADKAAGQVTLLFTSAGNGTGCSPVADAVTIVLTPGPTVDAGPDATICYLDNSFTLNGKRTAATNSMWTTTGTGSFSDAADLNATYQMTAADKSAGKIKFTLTASLAGCNNVLDEMELTISPEIKVTSGGGQVVCADVPNVAVQGTLSGVSQGVWSTSGTGAFAAPNQLNTTYSFSAKDIAQGSVTLTLTTVDHGNCQAVESSTLITITPAPTLFAGVDQTICADAGSITLKGKATVATAWQWTTSGTGTFANANALSTTYVPSAQDTTNKTVVLTLTTTASGTCNPISDQLTLTITPTPVVEAGVNQVLCADVASVILNGKVAHAAGGIWSASGSGTFFPDATDLQASYLPSAEDRIVGLITLTLTSTGHGTCNLVSDALTVNLSPVPTADAGPSTICADANGIPLSGTITVATAAVWLAPAGSAGTFTPSAADLNAIYHPTAAEIAAGKVTLTLTTTVGNGPCQAASDQIEVTITPTPTVKAGPAQIICADATGVQLSGQITVATGAVWSASGGGNFTPDPTDLNAVYHPSIQDIKLGKATLTLTTTGNGTCNPVSDQVVMTITPAPTVNAGVDLKSCVADNNALSLSGKVTVATGGTWTTSGSGTFPAGANILNTTYLPSVADKQSGKVTLTLTTTGNGTCNSVADRLEIIFQPIPTVFAGKDATICGDITATKYNLDGQVTNASGGHWTASGTGTFTDANALKSTYTLTAADKAAGKVTFTLTTTGSGTCQAVSHAFTVTITPAPTVEAGPDQTICGNVPGVQLAGKITIATGGIWTTSGSGQFMPSSTTLNATYIPSKADISTGKALLRLTSTGNGNCVVTSDSMQLRILPIPVLAGQDKYVCVGSTTEISTTNIAGATYQWMHNGANVGSNSNVLKVTVNKDETYVVRVTDAVSCATTDTIQVGTIPPPVINLSNVPACIGDVVTLNATPTNEKPGVNATYEWYKEGVKLAQATPAIEVTQPGTYSVRYTVGECWSADTSKVSFYPHPVPDAQDLAQFCKETDGKVVIDAGPGVKYLWLATGHTGRKEEVVDGGTYYVQVFNEFNCYTLDSVRVIDVCPPRIFVPTAFEPNGDGENDTFDVFGEYFKDYEMTIFNRWGEIIFYTRNRNEFWDGSYRGEPMPIGVYAWTITYRAEFKEYDAGYQRLKGSVTVVR